MNNKLTYSTSNYRYNKYTFNYASQLTLVISDEDLLIHSTETYNVYKQIKIDGSTDITASYAELCLVVNGQVVLINPSTKTYTYLNCTSCMDDWDYKYVQFQGESDIYWNPALAYAYRETDRAWIELLNIQKAIINPDYCTYPCALSIKLSSSELVELVNPTSVIGRNVSGYFIYDTRIYKVISNTAGEEYNRRNVVSLLITVSTPVVVTSDTDMYPQDGFYPANQPVYWYRRTGTPTQVILTDSELFGGVSYKQIVNTEDNLEAGAVSSAEITFSTLKEDIYEGLLLTYYIKQRSDSDWRLIGVFYVYSIDKNSIKYKIKAYDSISKFDKVVDTWLSNTAFPTLNTIRTVGNFFTLLCTECGASYSSSSFTNSDYRFKKNFTGKNLKGRTLLLYIAGVAGGYIKSSPTGAVGVYNYSSSYTEITNSMYTTAEIKQYNAPVIDQVKIALSTSDDSSWHYYPTAAGTYNAVMWIAGNPILIDFAGKEAGDKTVDGCALAIYNVVHNYQYTPMTVLLLEDYSINAGDRIKVGDKYTYIFSKEMNQSGVTLVSTSDPTRKAAETTNNQEIIALRNQIHVVENTESLHYRELSNTTAEIEDDVEVVTTRVASVEQTASGLTTRVSALDNSTDGRVTVVEQTASGLTVSVGTLNNEMANTLTFDNNGLIVKKDSASVAINGGNITLTGCIKFDDFSTTDLKTVQWLQTNGNIYRQSTVPTGTTEVPLIVGAYWFCTANIGTTYKANTWYTYNGSTWDLTSNPAYVHSTYIDSTEIRSPQITGNNIIVNADSGGAFQVQKNASTIGFLGAGSAYSGGTLYDGVVVANNTDGQGTYLSTDDSYLSITPASTKLTFAYMSGLNPKYKTIEIDSTGAWLKDSEGNTIEIGYARFG